ncbi:hypothetical protein A2U01_0002621 [Trifolium medium]|uniref:Uncharacterized protein n=1 Tax=Trifolium medium TaxID=97028 RepID=A0A392M4Z9_9FABA|nr:hypothetical protein [Trifolium medium]
MKQHCLLSIGGVRSWELGDRWCWSIAWRRKLFQWEEEMSRNLLEVIRGVNIWWYKTSGFGGRKVTGFSR